RSDPADERQLDGPRGRPLRDQLDRAVHVPTAPREALLDEPRDMFVHGRDRGQPEMLRDLFQARRVAALVDELADEIQDLSLPLGQRHGSFPPTSDYRA